MQGALGAAKVQLPGGSLGRDRVAGRMLMVPAGKPDLHGDGGPDSAASESA